MDPLMIWRTGFVSLLMVAGVAVIFATEGESTNYARTAAVNTLVAFEAVYLLSVRFLNASSLSLQGLFGNKIVVLAIGVVLVFQLLFTYTSPFQSLFGATPLEIATWSRIGAAALLLFLVVEAEKWVRRQLPAWSPRIENIQD